MSNETKQGLEGVVAAATRLSSVDGEAGELLLAGFPVEEIAPRATFEEMVHLLWTGGLPTAAELAELKGRLAARRALPGAVVDLLRKAAERRLPVMDALRMGAGALSLKAEVKGDPREDSVTLVAAFPAIVAAFWRLLQGSAPVEPREELGHAASFLHLLTGEASGSRRAHRQLTLILTAGDDAAAAL